MKRSVKNCFSIHELR